MVGNLSENDKEYIDYLKTLTSSYLQTLISLMLSLLCLFIFGCLAASEISADLAVESLQFDFVTIEAATNKFSDEDKIGEGGFGKVYKVHIIETHFLHFFFFFYITQNKHT